MNHTGLFRWTLAAACWTQSMVSPAFSQEKESALTLTDTDKARFTWVLTPEQKDRLLQALAPLHLQYDPPEHTLRQPLSSPGYCTTLKGGFVHPTRSSLQYAVALLDTGEESWRKRAQEILRRVVALQDTDSASKTYGLWSWFVEEPLAQMSPPDWNWADFCGTALLQVALYHRERLPTDLMKQVDAAIQHAARSIQRRDVGPAYTNIAIMGTYVTLAAAESFGLDDLREYAMNRLRRFHDYSVEQGAFTEYNSPTYTVVALEELARLRSHAKDAEAQKLIEPVYRMAWEEIAQHFHPPTRQWAGPHSRCYQTLSDNRLLSLIDRATDGRVSFGTNQPALDEARLLLPCPRDLEPFFRALDAPRDLSKTYLKGDPPVVGTTHLEPAFALGSISRGDLWNQRRPLLAYWGDAEHPSFLRVRFLHDGYDFAAAQFFSIQRGGEVLAGINFAIDGGDTHLSLDRIKEGKIVAKDLRLRFEFGGAASSTQLSAPQELTQTVRAKFDGLQVELAVPYAAFGNQTGRWEAGRDKATAWLDVVLFSGKPRTIRLPDLATAAIGLVVRLGTNSVPALAPVAWLQDQRLELAWDYLQLSLPRHPQKTFDLHKQFRTADTAAGKTNLDLLMDQNP